MGRARTALAIAAAAVALGMCAAAARADGPVGNDPSSNFPPGPMPPTCNTDPGGAVCVAAAVQYLDQARANLGQPPYQLPTTFVALSPDQQALVLSNLDRIQYGLPPIGGLTAGLNQDAAGGVQADNDPVASDPHIDASTANWAGGYPNLPFAYGVWMYDDGPGSGNLDCTTATPSGCWGHRHDVLWDFGWGGPLAMGAASGADPRGQPGYAMLLAQGDNTYRPSYTYTWNQAIAAGAGGSPLPALSGSSSSQTSHGSFKLISLRVRGHRLSFRVSASRGVSLQYSLVRRGTKGWGRDKFLRCRTSKTISGLRRGRYRLRIRAVGGATVTRYVSIR
jgi:hypothetical protein